MWPSQNIWTLRLTKKVEEDTSDQVKKTDEASSSSEIGQPKDTKKSEKSVKSKYDPPLTFKVVIYEMGL